MAKENHLWGAERIRGELLKLGIRVCKTDHPEIHAKSEGSTISRQTWATFVKN